jgi:hypothetical protein
MPVGTQEGHEYLTGSQSVGKNQGLAKYKARIIPLSIVILYSLGKLWAL